jgi:prepilin-type N-terminal cleavage/methylation domain-containing protein
MHSLIKQNKGITLIELLVALVISGILVGGIYRTFIGQQKTYTVQEQVVDTQQNVRALANRMMREIRMAGFGNVSMLLPPPYGSDPSAVVNIGPTTYKHLVNPDIPVAGSVTILSAMESTTIIGGIRVPVSITVAAAANSYSITVNSLTDAQGNSLFDLNDRKNVSIGGVESCYITNIAGTTLTLNRKLIYSHPVNTPVFAIRAVSYQVTGGTLLRDENTGQSLADRSLADNIETLQFVYLKDDGITQVTQQADYPKIRNLQVTLKARTNDSDPDYKSDGGYRKRTIASNVRLRNMGLWDL